MAVDLFDRKFLIDDDTGAQLSDWKALVKDGTFINAFGNGENTTVTMYTVPAGKKLYIFGMFIGAQNSATVTSIPTCDLLIDDGIVMSANTGKLDGGHEYNTLGLGAPIKVEAGDTVKVDGNRANVFFRAAIAGYLI